MTTFSASHAAETPERVAIAHAAGGAKLLGCGARTRGRAIASGWDRRAVRRYGRWTGDARADPAATVHEFGLEKAGRARGCVG